MIADDCSVALDHLDMSQASDPTQQADSPSRPVTSRRTGTSPAERKRQQRARDRQQLVYETPDWQLFIDSATLPQKAGCQPHCIRQIVLKELVDNALDAGANVTLDWDGDTWVVSDDGPGMDPADVPKLYAVNRPLLSSKLRRLPLRGMLGNGLRVVVGAVVAYGGSLVVQTRGRRLTLSICSTTGVTTVATDEPVPGVLGTVIRIGGRGWGGPETASLA
jgi:Histidine kinase-, DNA gyrase B-, and HSP90-like ATPase